jgi:hypothetical protein
MPDYTVTLTAEQDKALDVVVSRVNAALDKDAEPFTKESYFQQRASDVVDSYVAQVVSEEAQNITDAYKAADDAKRATVKSALGVVEAGVAVT